MTRNDPHTFDYLLSPFQVVSFTREYEKDYVHFKRTTGYRRGRTRRGRRVTYCSVCVIFTTTSETSRAWVGGLGFWGGRRTWAPKYSNIALLPGRDASLALSYRRVPETRVTNSTVPPKRTGRNRIVFCLPFFSRTVAVLGLLFISTGTGGIKPCVFTFGGDQFQLPGQEEELARYSTRFVIAINAGSLVSTFLTPELRHDVHCFGKDSCFPLAFGVPAALMLTALGNRRSQPGAEKCNKPSRARTRDTT